MSFGFPLEGFPAIRDCRSTGLEPWFKGLGQLSIFLLILEPLGLISAPTHFKMGRLASLAGLHKKCYHTTLTGIFVALLKIGRV